MLGLILGWIVLEVVLRDIVEVLVDGGLDTGYLALLGLHLLVEHPLLLPLLYLFHQLLALPRLAINLF